MAEIEQIPLDDRTTGLGMSFFPPIGTPLQIEIQDVSVKMSSTAVGYVAKKCLIITYPNTGTFGSVSNKLFKGNKVTVRYMNGGNVFGFQTEPGRCCQRPRAPAIPRIPDSDRSSCPEEL